MDFRVPPPSKSEIGKFVYGGFEKCLYPVTKFQSDPERVLAVILERESLRWFRPAAGQFQIFYRDGADHREYQPDFVAETQHAIYMLEPKKRKDLEDPVVLAKKEVAEQWCRNASDYARKHDGKPWVYALVPHDLIAGNMSFERLLQVRA